MNERCKEEVGEPPGYWHWHSCDRPAKWEVKRLGDDPRYVCGIHVKHYQRLPLDFAVIPLAAALPHSETPNG